MKPHLPYLGLAALVTCALRFLIGLAWGWSALAAFVGWPLLGTLVTIDDDLRGGWNNPDGTQRPDWATATFWALILRNASVAGVIAALEAAAQTVDARWLAYAGSGVVLAVVLHRASRRRAA